MVCMFHLAFQRSAAISPAEQFGQYVIEKREDGRAWELGRGAMGVTYRALDTSLQRSVALKLIKADFTGPTSDTRERFMREARAAGALRHPSVATVYQSGIDEETGQCFYAMELVEGETLDERVRRTGPLDVQSVIEIARQITAALAAAEKRGLVHRDLKPANVMIATGEEGDKVAIKVIDFGLAKALAEAPGTRALTRGEFIGTPAFASPEQFTDGNVDVRSDIYSLGATLWYLLTGRMPFGDRAVQKSGEPSSPGRPPLEQLKAAGVPAQFRSLLVAMLALEPAARPGVTQLAAKLAAIQAPKRGARLLGVAAVLALGGLVAYWAVTFRLYPQNGVAAPEKSIAVLPFENLSRDPDNAFFTDGVQDEILTDLAKVAELKVISRTSVLSYRDVSGRNVRKIGQELGVAHLLEGSVQRAGNRVRVNAKLIDARNDVHLWAQTYDRDLADVFAIQSEIAKAIADQLQAKLSPSEKSAIELPPTADVAAFDLYSRAKTLILDTAYTTLGTENLNKAVDLLQQALARDPRFHLAYCELAYAHDSFYLLGLDHTPERRALAEAALQDAVRLSPDSGPTHLAIAQKLYMVDLDYDRALAELKLARRSLPNDSRIPELAGYILRRRGQPEEGLQSLQRALDLDPRNYFTLQQISVSYGYLRRFAEQALVLDRAHAIQPDALDTKSARALVDLNWKADTRPFQQFIESIQAQNPAALESVADSWLVCALAERDRAAAEGALAALGQADFGYDAVYLSRQFIEGLIARMTNDEPKARTAFTAARAEQEKIVQAQPNYGPALCVLGLIDAGLGRKEEALREGRRAVELLPLAKDSINGVNMIASLAMTAAWVGEKDLACEQLAIATRLPSILSYGQLKLLPYWDPLRGDPRFEKIVASLAPKETK
ncbi:MAG: protein kinase [Spartobacteria bacterium]